MWRGRTGIYSYIVELTNPVSLFQTKGLTVRTRTVSPGGALAPSGVAYIASQTFVPSVISPCPQYSGRMHSCIHPTNRPTDQPTNRPTDQPTIPPLDQEMTNGPVTSDSVSACQHVCHAPRATKYLPTLNTRVSLGHAKVPFAFRASKITLGGAESVYIDYIT